MARNTAAQGREFEHSVIHYLAGCDCENTFSRPRHIGWRGFGYDFIRSAGSKGKVDLVAVAPVPYEGWEGEPDVLGCPHPAPLFIQCKITNPLISPAERQGLTDLATRAGATPLVAYRAKDTATGRVRPHFRLLTGTGPKDWAPWEPGEDD